jgi:hypothetical protein
LKLPLKLKHKKKGRIQKIEAPLEFEAQEEGEDSED